jgi:hypothetical protein
MSHVSRKRIVIADSYSTARDLMPELLGHNAQAVAVV